MMRFVACAALLIAGAIMVLAEPTHEKPGHKHELRKRLGHFSERPFIDLYKTYAAAFVFPLQDDRPRDDYRNYLPSGVECMNFLRKHRIGGYKVSDFDEFVVLDACLGYLYTSEYHERDAAENKIVSDLLKQLQEDKKLEDMFKGTKINELPQQGKECIANLLTNAIIGKKQYSDVLCNNQILQLYLQFAECQKGVITEEDREGDSYLKVIYETLQERTGFCVETELGHTERAVREVWRQARKNRVKTFLWAKFRNLSKQMKARMWPEQVMTLMSAVQNTTDEVSTREASILYRGLKENEDILIKRFLDNIAYYADRKIKPRIGTRAHKNDPSGSLRYTHMIDDMCNFFRSSDREAIYDFATPMIRLVEVLNHEELLGVSQKELIKKVLVEGKENTAMYLSMCFCNVLPFTDGAIFPTTGNEKPHYKIIFRENTDGMVLWPDLGYY